MSKNQKNNGVLFMTKSPAVLTKLSLGLPFNLGNAEFVTDETQVRAAWSLYVELITRNLL